MDFKHVYRMFALALRDADRPLRIVVVGANDGRLADPIYPFIKTHAIDAQALLIEPHPYLMPILKEHYAFLSGARFSAFAVGAPGTTTLYSVKPEHWETLQPAYAPASWPAYRAPLGITSADRDFVERWVRSAGGGSPSPDEAIAPFDVTSKPLLDVMSDCDFTGPIDILQIDTEGFDDVVLYHSALETTRPRMIAFEHGHLADSSQQDILEFIGTDYETTRIGRDVIGVRKSLT